MTRIRRINVSQVEGGSADNTDIGQIRPAGETAFYIGDNNKLTLMMFDGVRTHQKSKVLSPGVLFGSNADAGDGSTADTIKLIPDAALFNSGSDQYIVVDPTGGQPGHIHLRAGGTQDSSAANLYLGGEQTFVRVSDTSDDVVIRTGLSAAIENVEVGVIDELVPPGDVWRLFINDSTYPALGTTVQIGETVTTTWGTPVTATIVDIQQDAGNWQIHVDQNITAGFNPYNTVTFNRGSKTWTFDNTGKLTFPQGGAIEAHGMGWTGFTNAGNGAPLSMAYKDGSTSLSEITLIGGPTEGIVSIYTQDTVTESSYQWIFDNAGKTIFPGGMSITGVGATIQALTGNSINIETNDTQSVSANCAIAVGDEFVADTEFNDDITVVQVGWTVVVDGTTYTVTAIDPAPPANQYRITAAGATFVQSTTYTFTNPTPVAHEWTFESTGVLTTPGLGTITHQNNDLKVEVTGTDVIVLRTAGGDMVMNADGSLTFPDSTVQTTAFTGTGAITFTANEIEGNTFGGTGTIITKTVDNTGNDYSTGGGSIGFLNFGADGDIQNVKAGWTVTFASGATRTVSLDAWQPLGTYWNISFDSGYTWSAGDVMPVTFSSPDYVAGTDPEVTLTAGTNSWTFDETGALTFPDATVQTTALVQGEQVFTVNTGVTAYAPTAVDFNLLFVTSAIGYSETDPISVTLPNGVPGQRLVIFNGYNLATLTVNPGPVGRDISSGVVAEFIYSGFDGLWMPLYGTNSPT